MTPPDAGRESRLTARDLSASVEMTEGRAAAAPAASRGSPPADGAPTTDAACSDVRGGWTSARRMAAYHRNRKSTSASRFAFLGIIPSHSQIAFGYALSSRPQGRDLAPPGAI